MFQSRRTAFAVAAVTAVSIGDFNNETANEVAAALGGKENGAVAVYVNATDRDSVFASVDETTKELGGFDVIINNAGIAPQVSVEDATEKDFDTIFALNVKGVLWGIQAVTAKLKELGHGGKIISAASQAGHKGNPGIPLYTATEVRGPRPHADVRSRPGAVRDHSQHLRSRHREDAAHGEARQRHRRVRR